MTTAKHKVLVVGDLILDAYAITEVTRISPEGPIPVCTLQKSVLKLGGAANVAANIASILGGCDFLVLNADAGLSNLFSEQSPSVQLINCHQTAYQPPLKTRYLAGGQQLLRVDNERHASDMESNAYYDHYLEVLSSYSLVVVSDYDKGTLRRLPDFISVATNIGIPILVDPKYRQPSIYRGSTILKPNLNEFKHLAGIDYVDDETMVCEARRLLSRLGIERMFITLADKGIMYVDSNAHLLRSILPSTVYDVTGAGDCVLALIAVCTLQSLPVDAALNVILEGASKSVQQLGTYVLKLSDLPYLQASYSSMQISSYTEYQSALEYCLSMVNGRKIAFANGCFDILHAGHIKLLEYASTLADVLVVGLNDDESVRSLKGPGRPCNTLRDRQSVLNALRCVDFVVPFSGPTPIHLIYALKPSVIVKSSEYTENQVVGSDFVKSYGGSVSIFSLQPGLSTTTLIEKLSHAANP